MLIAPKPTYSNFSSDAKFAKQYVHRTLVSVKKNDEYGTLEKAQKIPNGYMHYTHLARALNVSPRFIAQRIANGSMESETISTGKRGRGLLIVSKKYLKQAPTLKIYAQNFVYIPKSHAMAADSFDDVKFKKIIKLADQIQSIATV
jgi:hypothetical protein